MLLFFNPSTKAYVDPGTGSEPSPTPIPCQSTYTRYCDGNSVWEKDSCNGAYKIQDCDVGNDQRCTQGPGFTNGRCVKYYHTAMSINPNPPELGNNDVKVIIQGTKSCNASGFTFYPDLGLGTLSDFKNTLCQAQDIKPLGCSGTGDQACTWSGTCVARMMKTSITDPNFYNSYFQATFNSNASLAGDRIGDCSSSTQYYVDPLPCDQVRTPIFDTIVSKLFPSASNSGQIVSATMEDDRREVKFLSQVELPKEATFTPTPKVPTPPPADPLSLFHQTGLQTGFFGYIQRLFCSNPLLKLTGFFICPADVNLAVSLGTEQPAAEESKNLVTLSQVLRNSKVAPEIVPSPAPKGCYIQDILVLGEMTEGDKDLDKISGSLSGSDYTGYYLENIPKLEGIKIATKSDGLSYNGTEVPGEERSRYLNCGQEVQNQALFPPIPDLHPGLDLTVQKNRCLPTLTP
ncbi:MAG: hypothetical protein UU73_C0002G0099 [Candidatus Daviesbacteria bacterium GW2011_GWA1_41_61]|nr:MAG: hypothetical protein UU44_C0001G0099 [Candidatus Daviesbacteria bacterium GW2011_GWB1_41_15]KKS15225.1 MAG: hypothetical protein UU73_C0002G0099 [Candidatus Daviesbacteria bacterium GW2011_GWA1_41_61]